MKITFFGTQPYDRESFDRANASCGFEFNYHRSHLNIDNVPLAQGADAVCIFVNDSADAPTVGELARMGVRLIALRCAASTTYTVRPRPNTASPSCAFRPIRPMPSRNMPWR